MSQASQGPVRRGPPQRGAVGRSNPRRNVTTSNNNNNQSRRRQQRRPQGRRVTRPAPVTNFTTPWFVAASGSITPRSPAGVLMQAQMHPASFPETPYSRACHDFTQRVERRIQLQLRCTTATTTGCRIACVVINDPTWNDQEPTYDLVQSMVANGRGCEFTVTGTQTFQRNFHVETTTRLLSNAMSAGNTTGISCGVVVVYLLSPPIALAGDGAFNWSLQMQVVLDLHGPTAGFMEFAQSGNITPSPAVTSWSLVLTKDAAAQAIHSNWWNSHSGSAWLAGGCYIRFPSTQPTTEDVVTITGTPCLFAVYQCNAATRGWMNNDSKVDVVAYIVTWEEPSSSVQQWVGFRPGDLKYAQAQAVGHTGAIPHGKEMCARYQTLNNVKWSDIFALPATQGGLTHTWGNEDRVVISFTLVYSCKYTKPVYGSDRTVMNMAQWAEAQAALQGVVSALAASEPSTVEPVYDPDDDTCCSSEDEIPTVETPAFSPEDEADLGFRLAASCASSRSSDGSRQRRFSFGCEADLGPSPMELLASMILQRRSTRNSPVFGLRQVPPGSHLNQFQSMSGTNSENPVRSTRL